MHFLYYLEVRPIVYIICIFFNILYKYLLYKLFIYFYVFVESNKYLYRYLKPVAPKSPETHHHNTLMPINNYYLHNNLTSIL